MPNKIGIIGGAGQIAWTLADYLAKDPGCEVIALCRSEMHTAPHRFYGRPYRVFDWKRADSVRAALDGIDEIIDCSFAPLSGKRDQDVLTGFYDTLFSTTSVRHLIHTSSVAVYGEISIKNRITFESPEPDTLYGAQKLATEKLISQLADKHSKKLLIARLGHVYGPGIAWTSTWASMIKDGTVDERIWTKPSNAIHIRQLCQQLAHATVNELTGIWNALGEPNDTWDQLLAFHREAIAHVDTSVPTTPSGTFITPATRHASDTSTIVRTAFRTAYKRALSSISDQPVLAQSIRRTFARFRFLPSLTEVKNTVGWDSIGKFFAPSAADVVSLLFDSIHIAGRNLPGATPLDVADLDDMIQAFEQSMRSECVQQMIDYESGTVAASSAV